MGCDAAGAVKTMVNQILNKLKNMSTWTIVGVSVGSAFVLATIIVSVMSLIFHGRVTLDYFITGGVTSLIVATLVNTIIAVFIQQLRETDNALRQAHNKLEIRVQERTLELATTNETLLIEIAERKQREQELENIAALSVALRSASARVDMSPIILDHVLDFLQADGAALNLRDPVTGESVTELGRKDWTSHTHTRIPPGLGIDGHVLATGQPYISDDIRNDPRLHRPDLFDRFRSAVCAPLIAQKQPIGTLWVGRKGKAFKEDEVRQHLAIANLAANALYRATLHEQTEQRYKRLAAVRSVEAAISASLDLRLTLNVFLDQVIAQLNVDAADVLLLNSRTQTLEYAAGRGLASKSAERTRQRLGEGNAGRAALDRRIVQISNLRETGKTTGRTGQLIRDEFVAYYGVPLVAKGVVKGVLEIFHRALLTPDPDWLDFLETLAGQAAIAIDNAELYDNLQRSHLELALAYDTTLEGWSRALDLRDKETEGHTQRVTEMTLRLARTLGIAENELVHVRRGALLHDIGKMGIPDHILHKPGTLTDEEWVIMRKHPTFAYELLLPIPFLRPALDIPYSHHEKWDGTGYPLRLKGEEIPFSARIFAVVDVWDALRSDRPYRSGWPDDKVYDHLCQQAGTHFEPQVVEGFLKLLEGEV
jgi:putative nucleotidyltransferase with HDIG domain